jgi:hypothetical protein
VKFSQRNFPSGLELPVFKRENKEHNMGPKEKL